MNIPLAALAAVLFVVAWNMSEVKHFIKIVQRSPRADVVILLVTFVLTVFVDLVVAVNIGVIIAILHFIRRMASSVEVQQMTDNDLATELAKRNIENLPQGVLVYAVDGPFFFAAAEEFQHSLAVTHTDPKVLIIRLRWVPFMDSTGLQTLEEIIKDLHQRKVQVILSGANYRVEVKLRRGGIINLIGETNFYREFSDAITACSKLEH